MENDIKMRVKQAMKELEISANALSQFAHLTRSTVNDQVNGASKMGVATIGALLAYRDDISAEWLLRGKGTMLKGEKMTLEHTPTQTEIERMRKTLARQQREIDGLYERIAELKGDAGYTKTINATAG